MNRKYHYSNNSKAELATCHDDLQIVFNEVIKVTNVDLIIVNGNRSIQEQQDMYAQGRTKPGAIITNVDGVNDIGKHNELPAKAVDICCYVNGKASWEIKHLCYLGGVVMSTANRLYEEGKIKHRIRWGGNWDGDGEIISDQNLVDGPHYEIID